MTAEQQQFINTIGNAAIQHYAKYKVLPSLTIAQIIKESNWGNSGLAKTCFNYTGMKWTSGCGYDYKEYNTKEWDKNLNAYVTVKAKFIKFKNASEGIEGHYKFLHKYKRYDSIIGETNATIACAKMGASGWATAPNYGSSLWNDYVVKYDLTRFDNLISVTEDYIIGKTYTLQSDLYIRLTPNGDKLEPKSLTTNAQMNAFIDDEGYAVLRKGTRVTCKMVRNLANSVWIQIPSGWICARNLTNIYVI